MYVYMYEMQGHLYKSTRVGLSQHVSGVLHQAL